MEKPTPKFEDFMFDVNPALHGFVAETHAYLLDKGYQVKLEVAKNGYVVSYVQPKVKRVIINYVFRKSGLFMRLYGDHYAQYLPVIEALPDEMAAAIAKASACKRLMDPTTCNSRCPMGYAFDLRGQPMKKCRYGCFQLAVTQESMAHLRALLEGEVAARTAEA